MQKTKLVGLIDRYFLNSLGAESVIMSFNDEDTTVKFNGNNKTIIGTVALNDGNGLGSIGMHQTSKFIKYLGAFDDKDVINITSSLNRDGIPTSIDLNNGKVNVTITTARPDIIPPAGKLDWSEAYDCDIKLTPAFMEGFRRYRNASNAEVVAFDVTKSGVDIILNWNKNNTNRIKYKVSDSSLNGLPQSDFFMLFDAKSLFEIFNVNKNANGRMRIASRGLALIELSDDIYETSYYVVQVKQK